MDLEIEIPIWFNGKMKWISNLSTRSTCSDVIEAILLTDGKESSEFNENYFIYECWRGVERPLKSRCRLLKLWQSWAGESSNVTLTLRNEKSQSNSTQFYLRQQEKKLNKLKRQLKRTDKQIEQFSFDQQNQNLKFNREIEDQNDQSLLSYLNLYQSIIFIQKQIESQEKFIHRLIQEIQEENQFYPTNDQFNRILLDVNQTLVTSRQLTEQSEQLDQIIRKTNEEIDKKQSILDELELDLALEQNIDLDSLDDENENENENDDDDDHRHHHFHQHKKTKNSDVQVDIQYERNSMKSNENDHRNETQHGHIIDLSSSLINSSLGLSIINQSIQVQDNQQTCSTSPFYSNLQKLKIVPSRPTAIVEPNSSSKVSQTNNEISKNRFSVSSTTPIHSTKESESISNGKIHLISFENKNTECWSQSTNNYSVGRISNSFHSIDDQLVTLV